MMKVFDTIVVVVVRAVKTTTKKCAVLSKQGVVFTRSVPSSQPHANTWHFMFKVKHDRFIYDILL